MFKKLFLGKFKSITSAALVISFAGLASRLLGVARDRVLAAQFGAGAELDVYYAAFRIPDLVYNLVIFGAISAGFIPVFTSLLKKEDSDKYQDNAKAFDLVNNVLTVFGGVLLVVGVILFILADYLVPWIAPGFSDSQLADAVALTRVMFLSPLLLGVSGIIGGVLQSVKRFFAFAVAPIMYNVGIIIGALFLVRFFGLLGLAYGVVLGAVLHLAVQLPAVLKLGYRVRWRLSLKDKHLLEIITMLTPRVIALGAAQINLLVVTFWGSLIAAGSITIYNLAVNLQTFPVGLIGIAYAIAAFPVLSQAYALKSAAFFKSTLQQAIRMILFAIIPITVIFIVLRIQIVRVVLGAGYFNWEDTILTADALGLFSVSLFAQALIPLLVRAFYARHNTVWPLIAGLSAAVVNVALSWWWLPLFGVLGLALAFSASSVINFFILAIMLRRHISDYGEIEIIKSFFKIVLASAAMGIIIQTAKDVIGLIVDMNRFWGIAAQGLIAGVVGLGVFAVVCHYLNCAEYQIFRDGMKKRLFKKAVIDESIRAVE